MNNKFLRSRVARRVFALFVACALLPMAAFTALSFVESTRELRKQHDHELQQSAKSLALEMFERLTMLDSDLQIAALRTQNHLASPSSALPSRFTKISDWDPGDAQHHGPLTAEELAHLRSGQTLLRTEPCANDSDSQCVVMIKSVEMGPNLFRLVGGEVSGAYLWSASQLPPQTAMLVLSSNHDLLFSSDPSLTSAYARPSATASFTAARSSSGGVDEFATRDLYLKAQFMSPSWTLIVRRTDRTHFLALQRFRNTLLLASLMAVCIVVLFSSIQIRRTMGPLDELKDATVSVADQNFERLVRITSADEFQELGASFNAMASRLGRQFHALRAISNIDQSVLVSTNLDAIVETTLASMVPLLRCDSLMVAIFDWKTSGPCLAKLSLRDYSSGAISNFADRIVPPGIAAELKSARSLELALDSVPVPEFLQPLAERGMRRAELFPILIEGKLFAAVVCAHSTSQGLSPEDRDSARGVADRLTVGLSNVALIEALEQLNWGTLTALARAIDAKSAWTAGHSERVTHMALRIARAMGLPERDLHIMQRGGLLHDIGKIGTPLEILDKPDKLTDDEMEIMRDHVATGVRILEPVAAFADSLPIVAQHHEWFNGGGYPAGLAGEEITLHARIFAVADCYDALISDRPYRKGLPQPRVIQMLADNSGRQFDPHVIDVFLGLHAAKTTQTSSSNSQEIDSLIGQSS